jgi:hypothetical protein
MAPDKEAFVVPETRARVSGVPPVSPSASEPMTGPVEELVYVVVNEVLLRVTDAVVAAGVAETLDEAVHEA